MSSPTIISHATERRSLPKRFASLVKIEHTVFSAPFAALGLFLGADGFPGWRVVSLVAIALLSARSVAMGFNRIIDQRWDSLNPRTQTRELVTGALSRFQAISFVVASAAIFVGASFWLNTPCGWLSFPTLVIVCGYSYIKRVSQLSHFALGFALGLTPGAGWLAVGASLSFTPILLGMIVVFWVGGFDILYALADEEFDKRHGLESIPARCGATRAIFLARLAHCLSFLMMLALYTRLDAPIWGYLTLLPVFGLFIRQHALVSADDLSRLDAAFFTMNGWIGVALALGVGLMYFLR